MKHHKLHFLLAWLPALLCTAVTSIQAATITVTNTADSGPGVRSALLQYEAR